MPRQPVIVEITSRDYWFKVVDLLQQNWALVDNDASRGSCTVFFFGDTSGVFDRLTFASSAEADVALRRNGFNRYDEDIEVHGLFGKPKPPFHERSHPNGPIYSSGRFWK